MEQMRNSHKIMVEKPKEKKQLGRHRHIWEDNITMDLTDIGVDVIQVNQDLI
jgi:hypothetical protein